MATLAQLRAFGDKEIASLTIEYTGASTATGTVTYTCGTWIVVKLQNSQQIQEFRNEWLCGNL